MCALKQALEAQRRQGLLAAIFPQGEAATALLAAAAGATSCQPRALRPPRNLSLSPVRSGAPGSARRNATFVVTEFGLSAKSFDPPELSPATPRLAFGAAVAVPEPPVSPDAESQQLAVGCDGGGVVLAAADERDALAELDQLGRVLLERAAPVPDVSDRKSVV